MCLLLAPFGKPSGGRQLSCANNRRSAEQCLMSSWEVSRLKTLMKEDPVCPPALAATIAPGSSCQGSSDPALWSRMMSSLCSPDWPPQQHCPCRVFPPTSLPHLSRSPLLVLPPHPSLQTWGVQVLILISLRSPLLSK